MEDKWLEQLKQGKCISEHDVKILCDKLKEILCEESNVQPVDAPVIVCGEGGEYETITLDCILYKKKIVIDDYEVICHSKDIYSPVYYSVIKKWHLEEKNS